MTKYIILLLALCTASLAQSQSNNNGRLDQITEFSTITTVPFRMPDGTILQTDVFLPIISDSVTLEFNGQTLELIPKGTQLFVYDSIGNAPNPNKYQLPLVFTRTPYNKGSYDAFNFYMNMLGYAYVLQDMRGRYESEGVYLPMYSDGWNKNAYHPNETHPLDLTSANDPLNGNFHQDGRHAIKFIMDSLYKYYDLDGDGVAETYDKVYNGSIVMFGASALGNTQYQAASSFQNDVSQDGLKGLIPIVATNEHFNGVNQHNGVFRQSLVQGWLTGQLNHNNKLIPSDNDIQNAVHSLFDYGNLAPDTVISRALDLVTTMPDANGFTGMYPNSLRRGDASANFAPVDAQGESDPSGRFNRYNNLELPIYHLTGWWDIFIDGQIETYNNIMANTSRHTQRNQKLIIGPWTHATIAQDSVADIVYPASVFDLKLASAAGISGNISDVVEGEVVDWLRYLLNYDPDKYLGEPKIMIPESNKWQDAGSGFLARLPAADYYLSYTDFINYLGGFTGLDDFPVQIGIGAVLLDTLLSLPADVNNQIPGTHAVGSPVSPAVDFEAVPNIRFYVPGPVKDGEPLNDNVGNYWRGSDVFPLTNGVRDYTLFLHNDGTLNTTAPSAAEPFLSYNHDPDSAVWTLGGGNLGIPLPQGGKNSGPLNYANPDYAPLTMDRADVLKFETAAIQDSLCIIGIPTAKIYASSTPLSGPNGPTDTDFFVRILDVYPDGREHYVVEGAVNARARVYSKLLANGTEDINAPYTNINSGQVYEFEFNMLPIAYTFGHNHKVKILISSSNFPRYQASANVPIEQGGFFRRTPKDGRSYTFNGTVYAPRIAQQDIYFTPAQASQITLPQFNGLSTAIGGDELDDDVHFIYPNPAKDYLFLNLKNKSAQEASVRVLDLYGKTVLEKNFKNKIKLDIRSLASGTYLVTIKSGDDLISEKIVVN